MNYKQYNNDNANPYCEKCDLDYYYYFRIDNIKKAKDIFNTCYNSLFNVSSIKNCLFSDDTNDDGTLKNLAKFMRLKADFNYIADKLIDGSSCESKKKFKKNIQNLMVIANDTIVFLNSLLVKNNNKTRLLPKIPFANKKLPIKNIIGYFSTIPHLINPDDLSIAATNILSRIIIELTPTMFIIFCITFSFNDKFWFFSIIMFIFFVIFVVLRIKLQKHFDLIDIKDRANHRNYNYVFHPFKRKKTSKNIMRIISDCFKIIKLWLSSE